jgi:type I restriction-modification system DNA methylase subunit
VDVSRNEKSRSLAIAAGRSFEQKVTKATKRTPGRDRSLAHQSASCGKARDTLGRVYEYFLGKFAQAEGKLGGEFYTPRSVVRVLVEMLEPCSGRV